MKWKNKGKRKRKFQINSKIEHQRERLMVDGNIKGKKTKKND